MTDSSSTTGTADAQGAPAAQAQGAPAQAHGADAAAAQGASGTTGAETVEQMTTRLAQLEKDNRSYRQRLKAVDDAAAARTAAEQTEVERLSAQLQSLTEQLTERTKREQEQTLRLASLTTAQRLGFKNPDLAYRLIAGDVQYDPESGAPLNVDRLLAELAKSDPYLTVSTDFGGGPRGATAASAGSNDMNAILRSAAGRR